MAHKAYVTEVNVNRQEVKFTMYAKANLDVSGIPAIIEEYNGALKFQMGETPGFVYLDQRNKNKDCEAMMDKAKEILQQLCKLSAGNA